jgi:GAF domain-containing protein
MRRRSRAASKPVKSRVHHASGQKPGKARTRRASTADLEQQLDRTVRERDEALEQQAATSEVLKVISRSASDLSAALDTLLATACRLCHADIGTIRFEEGDHYRLAATFGCSPEWREHFAGYTSKPDLTSVFGQTIIRGRTVHIPDVLLDPDYARPQVQKLMNLRAALGVPLVRDGRVFGVVGLMRTTPRSFTPKQIALVETFADQAVIAIENARLLNELRQRTDDLGESLEQQTATSDVLKVISSSPGELEPVFKAILENATRICEAKFGTLYLREADGLRTVAAHNAPTPYVEDRKRNLVRPPADSALGQVLKVHRVTQVADITAVKSYVEGDPYLVSAVKLGGYRTIAAVPMLKDNSLIGAITINRQEVCPFTDKQIELVENFAAQAVIAIENARLLNELRQRTDDLSEALEQQTATSDVLKVISSSPGDLEPVFHAMLENAVRICEAKFGLMFRFVGEEFYTVAQLNLPPALDEFVRKRGQAKAIPGSDMDNLFKSKQVVHTIDMLATPVPSPPARLAGGRTQLAVPMLMEGELIGAIGIYLTEVRPFTDKQIELVKNFAAQAVIAIENTRLLNELRQRTEDLAESLEQQTATSEVLKIISTSTGELEPIFRTMLENATNLCGAQFGSMYLRRGEELEIVATHNTPPDFAKERKHAPYRFDGGITPTSEMVRTKSVVHVTDLTLHESYLSRDPRAVAGVELGGVRSLILVPMLNKGEVVGCFTIYRQEVRPFTEKQIDLVKNFAAQAVIAIENARLLNELRESLEQQTATSEVLRVISTSPGELQPVFEAILENAVGICDGKFGTLYLCEADGLRTVATHNAPSAYVEDRKRNLVRPPPDSALGQVLTTHQVAQVADITTVKSYVEGRAPHLITAIKLGGYRTIAAVPMLKDDLLIGVIAINRQEVRLFTDKQIELVKNFAAQAVIAIENARLLNELRESLQQQTATSEVLKVISSSPGELEPVFRTMLENATSICGAKFGTLFRCDGNVVHLAAQFGTPPELMEFQQKRGPFGPEMAGTGILGRVIRSKAIVHSADSAADPNPGVATTLGGARSIVGVPMFKDDALVGVIIIYRQEVRPFTDKQIELLTNFAAQAVIAIENTRLLNELRESLQQQTATADVLKVISRSTFDLKTVLTTLVETAARVCEADIGNIARPVDGDRYQIEASYGQSTALHEELTRQTLKIGKGSVIGRTALNRAPVHILDAQTDPDYELREALKIGDYHTMLGVPLVREGNIIGVFGLARKTVRAFTEKQIELVTTFADQAVIAIENVRLFESVEARTRELGKSLEDLRTAQDRLVQTEKLASLGQLTAGIAHEIKNPLNFVNNFSAVSVELIDELRQGLAGPLDDKVRAQIGEIADMLQGNLDKVVQHGKRADAIVKNMLLHSRQGSAEHRPVDINALVEESLNLAYHGARAEQQGFNITLERSLDPSAGDVDVFPQDVTRVLLNLISNGFYAAMKRKAQADGGDYEPTLMAVTKNLGDSVEITIRDNGTGIPPEVKERMFNPFYTTKPAGEGTGLGLSISHDIIVKQHGGSIEVDTTPGEFTEIKITLPRSGVFPTERVAQA